MADKKPSLFSGVFDGVISTGIGSLVFTVFGLLGFMLSSRWLEQEELGVFVVLQVVAGFIVGISSLGLDLSITKFIAENEDLAVKQNVINTVVTFRLIIIALVSILAILLQGPLFRLFGESVYLGIIAYIPLMVLLDNIYLLVESVLSGFFRFRWMAFISGVQSISSFILIAIFLGWLNLGLAGRIWARLLSLALSILLAVIFGGLKVKLRMDLVLLRKIVAFSFPLFLNYLLSFLFLRADTLIIASFLGAGDIAVYEIARKIPESIESMYDAFRKVYFPYVADLFKQRNHESLDKMLNHSLRLISFAGVLGILIAAFFGDALIVVLFSERYADSNPLFTLLMIVLLLNVIDYTLGYTLVAVGESNKPPLINSVRTGFNFVGYFLFIPALRIVGVALANVLGIISVNPLNQIFLWKKRVHSNTWAFLKPMLLGAGCYAIAILLLPPHWFFRSGMIAFYLAASFAVGVLSLDDLLMVKEQAVRLLAVKRQAAADASAAKLGAK